MDHTGIKQVIVMRKDLNMRKGKMCAQAAHASMKVVLDRKVPSGDRSMLIISMTEAMSAWVYGQFTKICVGVNSEAELLHVHGEAERRRLPCALIQDMGHTEFDRPTYTCCAIGPANACEIDEITGKLTLL